MFPPAIFLQEEKMKRYFVEKRENQIIGGDNRHGWAVVERIGDVWGKKMDALKYTIAVYPTRKEAQQEVKGLNRS